MAMFIDPEAAAYGVFQIAFARLDTRLSRSLVIACRCKEAGATFQIVRRMPLGARLDRVNKLITKVQTMKLGDAEIDDLARACEGARSVQAWRNDRVHAEVRFSPEGAPVLTDSNGRYLRIDREECDQKIREAVEAGIAIETLVKHLSAVLEDIDTVGLE